MEGRRFKERYIVALENDLCGRCYRYYQQTIAIRRMVERFLFKPNDILGRQEPDIKERASCEPRQSK
jgi:hypothetical protein